MLRPGGESYVVLIPVLDDWEALGQLLELLDKEFAERSLRARVLVIDDGSQLPPPPSFRSLQLSVLREIDILRLRRNLGHQRAIAVGLAYIAEHLRCTAVVVMDGDGEDRPSDVPRLVEGLYQTTGDHAVFARRARRSERILFKIGYVAFCALHRILTGLRVEVGNFSVLPMVVVGRLGSVAEMWNHYAAAVVKARIPRTLIATDRGTRLAGHSRMNVLGLVTHGFSAMSVFADRIGIRLLVASSALGVAAAIGLVVVLLVRFRTDLATPGWATSTMGLLGVLLLQAVMLTFVFAVAVQSGRSGGSFLPSRDYTYFIESLSRLGSPDVGVPVPRP
ncbi:MAG: glycosyltransferase [Gemmatimonadota bacterium]|nr:glycosyltransferase [Gemmatimonadota bacterium]